MKSITVSVLLAAGVAGITTARAGINSGMGGGILSSQEKCASALNSYLNYRHETNSDNAYAIQKLEDQVDSLCEGYQVKVVENNGVMTGVIELTD